MRNLRINEWQANRFQKLVMMTLAAHLIFLIGMFTFLIESPSQASNFSPDSNFVGFVKTHKFVQFALWLGLCIYIAYKHFRVLALQPD